MMLALLTIALAVRVGWVWADHETLLNDRDAYLKISENLAHGNGFSSDTRPTAFRPPLYPMVLAGLQIVGIDLEWGLATLHVLLGTATVGLTLAAGILLGLGRGALIAGLFVALDPLLVRYTSLPMTETLAAFLGAQLLFQAIQLPADGWSLGRQATVGFLFGLAVLCRPTFWAWGALLACGWALAFLRQRRRAGSTREASHATRIRVPWALAATALVTVSPWVIRNTFEMGRPIVMTTHGGITLVLGNNPVFYDEVVGRPWGTTWSEKSKSAWEARLESQMQDAGIAGDELARDRWLADRACETIREQPGTFAQACWLRLRRFFQLTPLRPARADLPNAVIWPVGLFNLVLIAAFATGLIRLMRHPSWRLWAVAALPLAFTLVHCLYWSNARMRAPVVPAMALIAVFALCGLGQSNSGKRRA